MNFERYRKAIWTYKQPLTCHPDTRSAISDLFLWRKDKSWSTTFELMNLSAIINGTIEEDASVQMLFFDENGIKRGEETFNLCGTIRRRIELNQYIDEDAGSVGTFAVFHNNVPDQITTSGSYLAERGYTSYHFSNAPVESYVHGNLDAVSQGPGGIPIYLESSSFLPRQYCLQYQFNPDSRNEIALVNPTSRQHEITLKYLSSKTGNILGKSRHTLPSGGCVLEKINQKISESYRLVINSRLVMARPLIFSGNSHYMDVFHG